MGKLHDGEAATLEASTAAYLLIPQCSMFKVAMIQGPGGA
jgi:hypothetical protein